MDSEKKLKIGFLIAGFLKKKGVFSEQTLLPGMICRLQSIHKNRVLKAQKAPKPVQTLQGMDVANFAESKHIEPLRPPGYFQK